MAAPTVLVVDPLPQTAQRVEEAMAETGFAIVRAANAGEVEPLLEADEIAVVLTAITFPRGNGYDLARQVKARHPEAVVFLVCGGFEVYNADRAAEVGVFGRINRPFTVDALRKHLESALGPLNIEPEELPDDATARLEPLEPSVAVVEEEPHLEPMEPPPERSMIEDEWLPTFLPRDYKTWPAVRVDPAVVGPAMERAILEVLPVVVETVLRNTLQTSPAFRELIEAAVDEAVRQRIGPIARRVVRERLLELEGSAGDE
jgi:DNA-binding NarL/FixJ family response regulator